MSDKNSLRLTQSSGFVAPFCYYAYVLRISGWSEIIGFLTEFAH